MRALQALALLALCATVAARSASVIYSEPALDVEYSESIHPYAFATARPDPYYPASINAYNAGKALDLEQFLEVQTHLVAKSTQASSLLEVSEGQSQQFVGGFLKRVGRAVFGLDRPRHNRNRLHFPQRRGSDRKNQASDPDVSRNGFSAQFGRPFEDNAASSYLRNFRPVPSDFKESTAGTGSFPGGFRRGQYGHRRRRMPYFSRSEGFGSVNPFRRANNFFNAPDDMMFPKQVWAAARNPHSFDAGRAGLKSRLPYGGYSSFSENHKFRNSRGTGNGFGGHWVPHFGGAFGRPEVPIFSDGTPKYPSLPVGTVGHASDPFMGGRNMRWDGEKFAPLYHPHFGGPSPFIPGDYTYRDWYGSGSEGAAAEAPSSGGGDAPAQSA